jgi:maltooligosyltrehalose trehalohydrolase
LHQTRLPLERRCCGSIDKESTVEHTAGYQCGAIGLADGSVRWRVWAPQAERVELVLITGEARCVHQMRHTERGYFSHTATGISEGQRYAYRLDGGPERPDPASRWQPEGVHQASAVLWPEHFVWSDHAWTGIPREDLVFYELHVGTFTPAGTFEAVIPRLPALRDLGVTAIELMPIAQFPGTRNWGYDGVYPYAPQNSYGGPHGLQRLVNACHAQGMAIFLDVVYNHFGPEGCYVNEFGPYVTARYHTPWGRAMNFDDRGSDAVRAFVLDNVRMWLEDYHVDGLRLDAVHAIYDFGPRHILRDIKATAHATAHRLGRRVHVVAESDLNDVRLLLPAERGGYGLDAQWSDDFHHTVHAYLTGEQQGYYIDYGRAQDFPRLLEETFVLNGSYSRYRDRCHGAPTADLSGDHFVVGIQNHDQVGNRLAGERLGTLISPPAQRLAASLMLLAPHLPLLFMGEEYGEEHPFLFFCAFSGADLVDSIRSGRRQEFAAFHAHGEMPDPQATSTFAACRLTWSWEHEPHKAGLRRLYQDLLAVRRCWPAMRNFTHRAARLLPGTEPNALLELLRGGRTPMPDKTLQAYFNLTPTPQAFPSPRTTTVLLSTEAEQYHGQRRTNMTLEHLLPYECVVYGPATWQKYI